MGQPLNLTFHRVFVVFRVQDALLYFFPQKVYHADGSGKASNGEFHAQLTAYTVQRMREQIETGFAIYVDSGSE